MPIGPTPIIVVASQNPITVEATRRGFEKMFPGTIFYLHAVAASSGVRQQPRSDAETLQGALNRAQHAAHLMPQADYWVGIEGGVQERQGTMEAFAWIVVYTPRLLGQSRTGTFGLPADVATLIRQGRELGVAVEGVIWGSAGKATNGPGRGV